MSDTMISKIAHNLLGRLSRKAKQDPQRTYGAMSDLSDVLSRWGRPTDYDDLYSASQCEPTANRAVWMPAEDLGQVRIRVHRRRQAGPGAAEMLGLKRRRKAVKYWNEHGSRSVKAKLSQVGEDFEEVTDPDHPLVALLSKPNENETGFNFVREMVGNRRTAGGVFIAPIVGGGVVSSMEILAAPFVRVELDPSYERLILRYVAHRNGRDHEEYLPGELIPIGVQDPLRPGHFISQLSACLNEVKLLYDITEARQGMMSNGGHPGGVITSERAGGIETQRESIMEAFRQKHSGPRNAGMPLVLPGGMTFTPPSTGKELDHNASTEALQTTVKWTMGIPDELLATKDANLAGSREASPEYARRTLLPLAREIEDAFNEQLIPLFDQAGIGDCFVAFDDMVGEDREAETRVSVSLVQAGMLTPNEWREAEGREPLEGGDELLLPQAPADPFAAFLGKQKALEGDVAEELTIQIEDVTGKVQKAKACGCDDCGCSGEKADTPDVITYEDACYRGVKVCDCEYARPPRKDKSNDVDQTDLFAELASQTATATQEWYVDTYTDAVERVTAGTMSAASVASFVQAAADRFIEDTADPLISMFDSGYQVGGEDIPSSLGTFDVPSDRAAELYRQHRIGISRDVAGTVLEDAQRMVDSVMESGLEAGQRADEIAKALAEKLPGMSRSSASRIARTEVAHAQLMGRIEAWEDSGVVEGKVYQLSSDPCPICEYAARKWAGKTIPLREPILNAGEAVPLPGGRTYVANRDILTATLHPNCRCSLNSVLVPLSEDDE